MTGNHEPKYVDFSELSPTLRGQLVARHIYLSKNAKTGISVNSRIADVILKMDGTLWRVEGTCHPTQWCKKYCYARHGHFTTWDKSSLDELSRQQSMYMVNSVLFNHYSIASQMEVDLEADSIVGAALRAGYNNIRWNGGGDLSPGAVRIIDSITGRYPNFRIWGFTRRADLLKSLTPRHNLLMTVSLDPTTPPFGGTEGDHLSDLVVASVLHGGRMAFATEIPNDPFVAQLGDHIDQLSGGRAALHTVFGKHKGASHTVVGADKECPSTSKKFDGGCQTCRWCFMTHREKTSEGVETPLEAALHHQGE